MEIEAVNCSTSSERALIDPSTNMLPLIPTEGVPPMLPTTKGNVGTPPGPSCAMANLSTSTTSSDFVPSLLRIMPATFLSALTFRRHCDLTVPSSVAMAEALVEIDEVWPFTVAVNEVIELD
ncbi:hypothetical protein D3C72_1786460 [compost metagenome]